MLGLLLGRQGASGGEVTAAFREAIRLRPDFAAAHNNLGLVLVQSGDDAAGIAAFREAVRLDKDFADAHANLGAALVPTDAEEAVRELEKAVALAPDSVKARFNLAAAYGASPAQGPAKEIEQLQKVIELDPTFARARVALGKAYLRDGKVKEAVEQLQEATRLAPENGEARYQLGLALARSGRKEEATSELSEGPRARDRRRPRQDRDAGPAGGASGAREGRPRGRGGEAAARDPAAARLLRGPEHARGRPREEGRPGRRHRRVQEGGGAPPGRRLRACEPRPARKAGGCGRRSGEGGRVRALHPRGALRRGRAPARPLREGGAAAVALGVVRARLQPLRAAEDRRGHPGPGPLAPARRQERRGPQDPRPHAHDHRKVRRGPARVRGGDPAQAGLGGDALQPRKAALGAGQLGAGAQGARGGRPHRPLLPRSARRARVRARGPGRRLGGGREVRAGDRAQRGAARPLRLRPRELERLLQPHGRSGQGARLRAPGTGARSQVRRRLVPAGEGAGAPGASRARRWTR